MRHFLHSKPSSTKFILAARKLKRMKAFAIFKNETWYMEMAYVDKIAKDNNVVKYFLVRKDLFDRTVDAKGMKQKIPRNLFVHFWLWLQDPKEFVLTKEQKLLESLKNYAKLKEYKFTLQWVKPRLHLLNVQYDPWEKHFTVTWKTMDTSTFINWFNLL